MGYDVIVVGGGSAGCVLSARLSEDPSRRGPLVEAGPDYGPDLPADIAAATAPTYSHDWGYMSSGKRPMTLPRARLIGGCGATNAAFALRGFPTDYARWGPGWSFEDVLSTFCQLETDLDFSDPWHGLDGPLPITRTWPEAWTPLQRAFLEAAATAGHSRVEDHNRPGNVGAGPGPRNVRGGMRVSTALAYLEPARHRRNLEILDETPVDVIAVDHGRAGAIGAGGRLIEADAIVLAAGTYGSPAILLRSGIGNADQLLGLGLDVKLPLFGVGQNLQDHPLAGVLLP